MWLGIEQSRLEHPASNHHLETFGVYLEAHREGPAHHRDATGLGTWSET